MKKDKKMELYKYLFIVSTLCGAFGAFALYKEFQIIGWILVGIWFVIAVIVRFLIIKNRKGGN
ncbi:MAG: hypothetical protein LBB93_00630 [Elusimicrobiota bacterium]|nr:hypothetical protein [Elusimicrobiota bacterium]